MKARIETLIKAGQPAFYVVSHEEMRVEAVLREIAESLKFTYAYWSCTEGIVLKKPGKDAEPLQDTDDPNAALTVFCKTDGKIPNKTIFVMRDLHGFMDNQPVIFRKLKDACFHGKMNQKHIVVEGARLVMPIELVKEFIVLDLDLPDEHARLKCLNEVIDSFNGGLPAKQKKVELNAEQVESVVKNSSGLTGFEMETSVAESLILDRSVMPHRIASFKAATVKKNGILEVVESNVTDKDIGGLVALKEWMGKRAMSFTEKAREFGLPTVKGILCTGIPGTGKSLSAKAAANVLGMPLLKCDFGNIFAKHVGESEGNLRSALKVAEAMAPCVLMVDELEKSLSGLQSSGSSDGGTSARVIGTFLQWMQEKTAPVFVFATCNNIHSLPPELLRKGRFDEIFFVDLPNSDERREIWEVVIKKFKRMSKDFDLVKLVEESEAFSGAEIEGSFTEAMFNAFADSCDIATKHVLAVLEETTPLSIMRKDDIDAMRLWAKTNARSASTEQKKVVSKASRKMVVG